MDKIPILVTLLFAVIKYSTEHSKAGRVYFGLQYGRTQAVTIGKTWQQMAP